MYRSSLLLLVVLLSIHLSQSELIWAADNTFPSSNVTKSSNFTGIVGFQNSSADVITSLDKYNIVGFCVDVINNVAYVLVDSTFDVSIFTVNISANASEPTISTGSIEVESGDQILDVAFDGPSGKLIAIVQTNDTNGLLNTLNLLLIDPSTGSSAPIYKFHTTATSYFSSFYSDVAQMYWIIMGNENGTQLFSYNNTEQSESILPLHYEIFGLSYIESSQLLIGNIVLPYSNQLAVFNFTTGNLTTIGEPITGFLCGVDENHAALDSTESFYFTTCCTSIGCDNSTLVQIELSSSTVVNQYAIEEGLQLSFGFYWINQS